MPVVAAAGIAAIGSLAASSKSASAAKSAARTQANALKEASAESREAAEKARIEMLNRIAPALTDYNRAMVRSINDVKAGSADVMQILSQSTANASELLSSAGANASMAILGSRAYTEGTPRQSFEQSFASMDPHQINQAVNRTIQPVGDKQMIGGNVPTGAPLTGDQRNLGGIAGVAQTIGGAVNKAIGGALTAPEAAARANTEATRKALTQEDFMVDVPAGRMVKNPAYQGGDAWNGEEQEIWKPYTDAEREQMGYERYKASGEEAKMLEAKRREAESVGKRDPTLTEVAEMGTPQGSAYLPQIQTGSYPGGPGYFTSVDAIEKGQREGLASLAEGAGIARRDISGAMDRIRAGYDPYTSAGAGAVNQEAALSGALGPEAQQKAIDAFIESPGQKYLREQQEKALLRNSAAIGGLGGGNVRTALQEQAMGIASTQQQQYLENLRSLASRGQEATGAVAGFESSAAANLAQIANSLGINSSQLIKMSQGELAALAERTGVRLADIQSAVGAAQAEMMQQAGTGLAGVAGATAGDVSALRERQYTTGLQAETDIATKLANLATQSATQSAQYNAGAGGALATGQYLAGRSTSQGLQGVANLGAYAAANWPDSTAPTPVQPTLVQPSVPYNMGTAPIQHSATTAYGM